MSTTKTADQSLPKPMFLTVLTDEELKKMTQDELGELIDEVNNSISSLNKEIGETSRGVNSIKRFPSELQSRLEIQREMGQLKARIAALHQYRSNIISHWRRKEGLS